MNRNSQSSYAPPQPDNPSDSDRRLLAEYALTLKGWPEDLAVITKLMAPPPEITKLAPPGSCKGLKVGVIGGGLAGLAAAFELRKLGFDITVFEALDDRIGGRVYTYYFNQKEKLYHEFGAMRIPVTHETVWHYLNLFGLPTRPFIQYNPNAYVYIKKIRVRSDPYGANVMRDIYPEYRLTEFERKTNWQKLLAIGTESPLLSASTEERAEILQSKPWYREKPFFWANQASITMMEQSGLSQEAISLVSNFHPLLYGNLYHSYIDFIEESYPADTSYLYEIPGGMARLPQAFVHSFQNSNPYQTAAAGELGKVHYFSGCSVTGIYQDGEKIRLKYQERRSRRALEKEFDYTVCAIPFSTLRTMEISPLFSSDKMRAIREVHYTSSQKSLILCKERFWEKDGIVGGGSFTDLPISSIWYPSDHARFLNRSGDTPEPKPLPVWEPGVLLASYNFDLDTTRLTNLPEGRLFSELKREIGLVHGLEPDYLDRVALEFKTVNWEEQPTFRGALSFFSIQQKNLFAHAMTLPEYNGRVFFAGEHISPVHRWMQGALQSGMKAADDLVLSARNQK